MGKTESNTKRFNKVIIFGLSFFFLILLLVNLVIIIKLNQSRKQIESEIYTTKNVLSEQKKEYITKLGERKLLLENIDTIKNVESSLEDIRKEFFENAQEYEKMVSQGKGSKKIAYITIDDGPYSYTPAFLDVLDKYDILATFFLLGKPKEEFDPVYKRIYNSGHTIANHTYSHAIWGGLYASVDSFVNDVLKQERFLYKKLGVKTNILRFPGGSSSAIPPFRAKIIERLRAHNYGYVDWNVSSGDAGKSPSKEKSYNNIINGSKNKNIIVILMHDFSKASLSALPSVIEELKARDYIFLPLFYESSMIRK
ncbi:MAG: polysaccharide deacetylase family protein [Candidatus Dojkabacteria bacterium]